MKEKRPIEENIILKALRKKLDQNQIITTKVEKGQTIVLIKKDNYIKKVKTFIQQQQYVELKTPKCLQKTILQK